MYRFAALQGRQDQTFEETVLVAPAIQEITTFLKKFLKILNHKRRAGTGSEMKTGINLGKIDQNTLVISHQ